MIRWKLRILRSGWRSHIVVENLCGCRLLPILSYSGKTLHRTLHRTPHRDPHWDPLGEWFGGLEDRWDLCVRLLVGDRGWRSSISCV